MLRHVLSPSLYVDEGKVMVAVQVVVVTVVVVIVVVVLAVTGSSCCIVILGVVDNEST